MERMLPWHPCDSAMVLGCQDTVLQWWCAQTCLLGRSAESSSTELWLPSVWENPITSVLTRAFVQCLSKGRKFAQLLGRDFNRKLNHSCFFIPTYSCQGLSPFGSLPFLGSGNTYKSLENLCYKPLSVLYNEREAC